MITFLLLAPIILYSTAVTLFFLVLSVVYFKWRA